jgi:hypothetical protein
MDEFQKYNPAKAQCISVYQPIVKDLLQYWAYSDSVDDVRSYLKYLFTHHFQKSDVPVPDEMVAAIYLTKKALK